MKALIQRVSSASVDTADGRIGQIGEGVLALVALMRDDDAERAGKLAHRLVRWPVFTDDSDRITQSLLDRPGAGLLVVPQFTLAADGSKGIRADYGPAMPPAPARELFARVLELFAAELGRPVQSGEFAATMQVQLCNEGPVTFLLEQG